jgi:alkanesulfonate monooxygenase SsuD/methylene tetrahydromethanopterin reductase-like flavin-dependent oxidoreductase (luciferase family)
MSKHNVAGVLADIRKVLEENLAGATSINAVTEPNDPALSEEADDLDSYMAEAARYVSRETGLDEDEALEFCFELAEAGAEAGLLPEFPGDDATAEIVGVWLEAAADTGFIVQAITQVAEQLDEEAKHMAESEGQHHVDMHHKLLKQATQTKGVFKKNDLMRLADFHAKQAKKHGLEVGPHWGDK